MMSYYGYSYADLYSWQQVLYCNWSAGAILFFDHILTLGDEIDYIWRRKFSAATFLFVVNRYSTICKTAMGLMLIWADTERKCLVGEGLYKTFDIIALFVFAAFSSFRVWAIWGRDLRPFLIVLLFALVTPGLNLYRVAVTTAHYAAPPPPPWGGCYTEYGMPLSLYIIDIVRGIAIGTDGLVLVMTWIKTYSIYQASRRANIRAGISELLLRDGTTFFGFLLVFNVVQLILNHVSPTFNPANTFNDVVNCVLISRFMLNLRSVGSGSTPWERGAGSATLTLDHIRTHMLGDLGAPIVFADTDADSDSDVSDDGATRTFEFENGPLASGLYARRAAHDVGDHGWETERLRYGEADSAAIALQPCFPLDTPSIQDSDHHLLPSPSSSRRRTSLFDAERQELNVTNPVHR